MTTAESLNALADRVEREEPNGDLNCAVALAAGWRLKQAVWWKAPKSSEWTQREPDFLRSLDAAVTLVPAEGAGVFLESASMADGAVWRAVVGGGMACWGETPAAALTAAALRARAALLTDGAVPSRTA